LAPVKSTERRTKFEIYYIVLEALASEIASGYVKPTKVQFKANMSYVKMTQCLDELFEHKMIRLNPYEITKKGQDFLQEYGGLRKKIETIGLRFLNDES